MTDTSSTDSRTRRRRWVGVVCLLMAVCMVVADEFVSLKSLPPLLFFAYWLVCFLLTVLAAVCALGDLRAVRQRGRQAQRDLMEETIREIEHDHESRHTDDRKRRN